MILNNYLGVFVVENQILHCCLTPKLWNTQISVKLEVFVLNSNNRGIQGQFYEIMDTNVENQGIAEVWSLKFKFDKKKMLNTLMIIIINHMQDRMT